jgi:hypothetical protein
MMTSREGGCRLEQKESEMLGNPSDGDVIGELLNRINERVSDIDGGGSGSGNGNGRGGNGGGGREPFEEMARALFGHMHALHQGFAEHALTLINALVQGHAELKDENKELRRRLEALEAGATEKDVEA